MAHKMTKCDIERTNEKIRLWLEFSKTAFPWYSPLSLLKTRSVRIPGGGREGGERCKALRRGPFMNFVGPRGNSLYSIV